MPASARIGDIWTGTCCCHPPYPCIPMAGYIVTGSPDITSAASACILSGGLEIIP